MMPDILWTDERINAEVRDKALGMEARRSLMQMRWEYEAEISRLEAAVDEYETSNFFYQNAAGHHKDYILRLEQQIATQADEIKRLITTPASTGDTSGAPITKENAR